MKSHVIVLRSEFNFSKIFLDLVDKHIACNADIMLEIIPEFVVHKPKKIELFFDGFRVKFG